MLTLWGRATSSNVQKVHWLCSEIGLDIRRIDAGGKFGNTDTPEYLSKNPNGLIPVLEDEDLVLWESNAILRYVSAKHGNNSFYPTDAADRAVVDQWMDWQLGTLWPGMRPFFIDLTRTPEAEREHAITEALRDKSFALWSVLETYFTSREWIAGTAMSLAEIALGPILHRWFALYPEAASQQPALYRLYQQLTERPAYQEHVIAQPFR
jgi:glutathione S-transferase